MNAQTVVPPQSEPNRHREDSGMAGPLGGIGEPVISVDRDDEVDRLHQVIGDLPEYSLLLESAAMSPNLI